MRSKITLALLVHFRHRGLELVHLSFLRVSFVIFRLAGSLIKKVEISWNFSLFNLLFIVGASLIFTLILFQEPIKVSISIVEYLELDISPDIGLRIARVDSVLCLGLFKEAVAGRNIKELVTSILCNLGQIAVINH